MLGPRLITIAVLSVLASATPTKLRADQIGKAKDATYDYVGRSYHPFVPQALTLRESSEVAPQVLQSLRAWQK